MDHEKILSFCAVVETGGMSSAARRRFCTQPAISKHIAALEEELSCRLFDRQGKRLILTESGRRVYAFASRCAEDYGRMQDDLYRLRLAENHSISFGATNFIGTYWVPRALAVYKEREPDKQVLCTIDFWRNLLDLLLRGKLPMVLAPETDELLERRDLDKTPIASDPMCLLMSPGHPLASEKTIAPETIARYPLLLPGELSATRRFVVERLNAVGVRPKTIIDLGTAQAVKQGVIDGMGIAILSERSVQAERRARQALCRPIRGLSSSMTRTVYALKLKGCPLSPEEQSWIAVLRGLYAPESLGKERVK